MIYNTLKTLFFFKCSISIHVLKQLPVYVCYSAVYFHNFPIVWLFDAVRWFRLNVWSSLGGMFAEHLVFSCDILHLSLSETDDKTVLNEHTLKPV